MPGRPTRRHDREDLEQLFRAEYARLGVVLRAQTRDAGAAEEIAQEAFAAAARHWPKVRKYDDPKAWLWLVALRHGARWGRREAIRPRSSPAAGHSIEIEQMIDLHDAIRRLPRRQREVVVLHYFADLS